MAGPAPAQPLKASNDSAEPGKTGREFKRHFVEGKKKLLQAFTEQ